MVAVTGQSPQGPRDLKWQLQVSEVRGSQGSHSNFPLHLLRTGPSGMPVPAKPASENAMERVQCGKTEHIANAIGPKPS